MKRVTELDSMRGIAALAVVLYHYTSRFDSKFGINTIASHFDFVYGKHGVELFFTISGFVIFMSIDKIRSPFEFIYKRFIRLYPTFWISMIITYIIVETSGPATLQVSVTDFINNFTMLPDLLKSKSVDGAYWTLKIEMLFYFSILLLIGLKYTDKIKTLGYGYLFIGIVLIAMRFLVTSDIERVIDYYIWGSLFLAGINFYFIRLNDGTITNHIQIAFSCSLAMVVKIELGVSVLIICVLFYLLIYGKLTFLSTAPFVFFGKISYALYLVHQNIGYTIILKMLDLGISNYVLLLAVPILLSISIAYIITYWVEKPVLIRLSNFYKLKLE